MFLQKISNIYFVFFNVALFVLMLLLPSINNTDYVNSTITSKTLFFIWSLIIISILLIFNIIFKSTTSICHLKLSKIDISVFILFAFITVNRYFIQSDYGFSIRYIELLGLSVSYILLRSLSFKNYVWILLAIVVSGSIQAIYGNLQLLGYYPSNHSGFKLTGSFFNPGPYAGFLSIVFILTLGLYLYKDNLLQFLNFQNIDKGYFNFLKSVLDNTLLIALVSIILVIPATHSRGAWLCVLLGSLFLVELRYSFIRNGLKKITRIKKIALAFLVLSIFFTALFGIYHFKKGSADGRLFIWKVTSEIIKDFPITGVGFDRFKVHYMNYQASYFAEYGETKEALVADNSYYAFNEGFQFVAENGFIGFLILCIVLFIILRIKVDEKNNCLFLIIKGTLLAIGVFALFSYPMQILPIKLALIIMLALLASLDIRKHTLFNIDKNTKPYMLRGLKIIVFTLVGIVGFLKGVAYTQTLDSSFKTWKRALNIYQYGDYEGAISEYAKAYTILKKDGDFLMNYGKALAMHKQNGEAVQVLEETKMYLNTTIIETALGDAYKGTKQYNKAEVAYQHAANMIPVRFYPLYLQAKLYEESEQNGKAIAMAKTILNKDIKVPSTAIKEIKAEMKKIIKNNK